MDDIKHLKAMEKSAMDGGDYEGSGWGMAIPVLLLIVAFSAFIALEGDTPHATPYPTEIPTNIPAFVAATSPRLLPTPTLAPTAVGATVASSPTAQAPHVVAPTWTAAPTYTPLPTHTVAPTAVPTQTPLPTYTAAPTYTPLSTWTVEPTRPVMVAQAQPTAVVLPTTMAPTADVRAIIAEYDQATRNLRNLVIATVALFVVSLLTIFYSLASMRRGNPGGGQPVHLVPVILRRTASPEKSGENFIPRNPHPATPEVRAWRETAVSNVGNVGNTVSNVSETAVSETTAVFTPFDRTRPPNEAECAYIRKLHAEGQSLRNITKNVYGVVGGKTFGYVKLALTGEGRVINRPPQPRRLIINTSKGRIEA